MRLTNFLIHGCWGELWRAGEVFDSQFLESGVDESGGGGTAGFYGVGHLPLPKPKPEFKESTVTVPWILFEPEALEWDGEEVKPVHSPELVPIQLQPLEAPEALKCSLWDFGRERNGSP
jgi:hypothetical protein